MGEYENAFKDLIERLRERTKKSQETGINVENVIALSESGRFDEKDLSHINYGPLSGKTEKLRTLIDLNDQLKILNDKQILNIGRQMGEICQGLGDWDYAIQIYQNIMDHKIWNHASQKERAPILKGLGISFTKKFRTPYLHYIRGREYIEQAIEFNREDEDALASLAGTWKSVDDEKAYKIYLEAFEKNRDNPYPLINILIYELMHKDDISFDKSRLADIKHCLDIRRKQIDRFEEIPWSLFDAGFLTLLLLNPQKDSQHDVEFSVLEATNYFALAILLSDNYWTLKTTLDTYDKIYHLYPKIMGIDFIILLLLISICFKIKKEETPNEQLYDSIKERLLNSGFEERYSALGNNSILILGDFTYCNPDEKKAIITNILNSLRIKVKRVIFGFLNESLKDLILKIRKHYPQIPIEIYNMEKKTLEVVSKNELIKNQLVEHKSATKLDIMQFWFNILNSNFAPKNLKILEIGGNSFNYFEFITALAFNTKCGFIKEIGGATNRLINPDSIWKEKITDKSNANTFRLFKSINVEEIGDFIQEKYFKQIDNDYIHLIIIKETNGDILYQKPISKEAMDQEILQEVFKMISLLIKKDDTQKIENFRVGKLQVEPRFLGKKRIQIIFFLSPNDSKSLLEKIDFFTHNLEIHFAPLLVREEKNKVLIDNIVSFLIQRSFGTELLS